MSVEEHQNLIRLIENFAIRSKVCENLIDKELMEKVIPYLIKYQIYTSRSLKE